MKRTGILLAVTLVVCVAYAEPPEVPVDTTPPPATPGDIATDPAEPPLELAPLLPNDVRKVREQFKSPLDGSILGKADEKEFRAAYEKLRQASPKADFVPRIARDTPRFDPYQASETEPDPTFSPPWPILPPPTGGNNTTASIVVPSAPNDLLTATLRLELEAYQLDRLGEYGLADELRQLNQRIRERARAAKNWNPAAPRTRSPGTASNGSY